MHPATTVVLCLKRGYSANHYINFRGRHYFIEVDPKWVKASVYFFQRNFAFHSALSYDILLGIESSSRQISKREMIAIVIHYVSLFIFSDWYLSFLQLDQAKKEKISRPPFLHILCFLCQQVLTIFSRGAFSIKRDRVCSILKNKQYNNTF